jgi:hypothetical protein
MSANEIGKQIVDLCVKQKFLDAIDTHYHKDVVSVESMDMSGQGRETKGFKAVRGKSEWWLANNQVHSVKAEGPFPHGESKFAVIFDMDVTPKAGPMSGQRMQMRELGVYTLKDGKVSHEEFFYGM